MRFIKSVYKFICKLIDLLNLLESSESNKSINKTKVSIKYINKEI